MEIYTVHEVAEILGCKQVTIYDMTRNRQIGYFRVGWCLRFMKIDVEEFVATRRGRLMLWRKATRDRGSHSATEEEKT